MNSNPGAVLPLIARAKGVAAMDGGYYVGEQWLRAQRKDEHTLRMYAKAGVPASSTGNSDLDIIGMIGAYTQTLRSSSAAIEIMLRGGFRKEQFHTKLLLVTTAPTAKVKPEGHAAVVSRIVYSGQVVTPETSTSIIAPTREMVRALGSEAETSFNQELEGVLGAQLDADFFAALVGDYTAAPIITASGTTSGNALFDLRAAMLAVNALGKPQLYWVLGSDAVKMLVSLGSHGIPVFPSLTMTGGELLGATAIISSGIAANSIYLVEGSLVAANIGAIEVVPGPSATLEMVDPTVHDAVTPTPAQLVSAFQNDLFPLRGTIMFGAQALRPDAIVRIENVDYGSVAQP